RLHNSDRLLVRLAPDRREIRSTIASMRDAVPNGLTPLADVRVSCDAACDAAVYLNPQTLDAIAIVRPNRSVTAVTVAPTATALSAFGAAQARSRGPRLDLPATGSPFALQIHGWRGDED